MSKRPYYTSDDLIEAVKRKISMPITQVTFSDDEILRFANEELFLAQVPSMMQYHEEYLVYRHNVPLISNKQRYDIPNRAIGMKLRDLFFKDEQGNLYEMSNIGLPNQDFFQQNTFSNNIPRFFYVENNSIVLPSELKTSSGSLEMIYYLRPNSLVKNDRAAISNNFTKLITIDHSNIEVGDKLTINNSILTIPLNWTPSIPSGVSSSVDAQQLSLLINNLEIDGVNSVANGNLITVTFEDRNMLIQSNNSDGIIVSSKLGISCNSIPSHFKDRMFLDFLETSGGHKTYSFDIRLAANSISGSVLFFENSVVPDDFKLGDYICENYECIIPQVPSDLHNLLAERTCARLLEALGDQNGLATANAKIAELEQRQASVLDNRVEGAPRKIVSRHSLLKNGKNRRSRGSSI